MANVQELCSLLANVSPLYSPEDVSTSRKLSMLVSRHLLECRSKFFGTYGRRPILQSYSSDATSFLCRTQVHLSTMNGDVQRRGRLLSEFLSERVVLKSITAHAVPTLIFVKPPRILSEGKKIPNFFTAGVDSVPMARREGCESIVVNHCVFDRAVHGGLSRMMHARTRLYYDTELGVYNDDDESFIPSCKEWDVETGCSAHDASGSLKWALDRFGTKETHDNLFIAIESLRNSVQHLASHITSWLSLSLVYCRTVSDESEATFWRALGVPATWVDDFVRVGARFQDGQLQVRSDLRSDPDPMARVTEVMLFMMHWRKFAMTRFLGLGFSSRSLLRSLVLGIDGLMAHTRSDKNVSEYHAHGWDRCGQSERRFVVIAALSSYPAESFLGQVLYDDRIARDATAVRALIHDELKYLSELPRAFWEDLSGVLRQGSWSRFRHNVVSAAHTSVAYLSWRCVDVAMSLPWSLCNGDIRANLLALKNMELPPTADRTTLKIQCLLKLGVQIEEVIDGVKVMGEAPWTSKGVEEQHGSIAVLHKYHPDLSSSSLAVRAFLHICRALFRPDADSKALGRLRAKCERLADNRGRSVSARNEYIGEMVCKMLPALREKGYKGRVQNAVLKKCYGKWSTLSPLQRERFEQRARRETKKLLKDLSEDRAHAQAQLELFEARAAALSAEEGSRNVLSACRFGQGDFERLESAMESPIFSTSVVDHMVERAIQGPVAPEPHDHALLASFVTPASKSETPPWLQVVAVNRSFFHDTILCSTQPGHENEGYMFFFALQQPVVGSFLKLRLQLSPVLVSAGSVRLGSGAPIFRHEFVCDLPGQFVHDASALPFGEAGQHAEVIGRASFVADHRVVSDCKSMPFADFVKDFEPAARRTPRVESTVKVPKDLLAAHPWLASVLGESEKKSGVGRPVKGGGVEDPFVTEMDDDVVDRAWAALYEKREEWDQLRGNEGEHFPVSIRGGRDTLLRKGVPFDCVSVAPKGSAAASFLEDYRMQKMHSFALKKYTEHGAMMLAREVSTRYDYFYRVFRKSDDSEHVFSQAEIAAYAESAEWVGWFGSLEFGSYCWARATGVRSLRPARFLKPKAADVACTGGSSASSAH
jgi:hypothetical protein